MRIIIYAGTLLVLLLQPFAALAEVYDALCADSEESGDPVASSLLNILSDGVQVNLAITTLAKV